VRTVKQLLDGQKPDMPTPMLPYIKAPVARLEKQLTLGTLKVRPNKRVERPFGELILLPSRTPSGRGRESADRRPGRGARNAVLAPSYEVPVRRASIAVESSLRGPA